MTGALIFLAVIWGVSPLVLFWLLIQVRDEAKKVPGILSKLATTEWQKNSLAEELAVVRNQVDTQRTRLENLGKRLLKDNVRFIGSKVTANNYATSKKRFEKVFDFSEKNGYFVAETERREILQDLEQSFEEAVRKQWHKEEQARIKRQIREEQKLEADRQKELQRLENEQFAVETALQKALRKAKGEYDAEVERLRALLEEAQSKLERAKSMAELTKAGFVYVISNIGSFGENVFKVGMTRRLEPLERVRELGDASVPFSFDVHMMISCDDAPSLESKLHKELARLRVNKVKPRKEFYRVDIHTIGRLVEKHHGKIDYVAAPEALEYNESLSMSEEDFDYISRELKQFEEDEEGYRAETSSERTDVQQTKKMRSVTPQAEKPTNIRGTTQPTQKGPVTAGKGSRTAGVEQDKGARRLAPCPRCKGPIYIDILHLGENTCPHCNQVFQVRRPK